MTEAKPLTPAELTLVRIKTWAQTGTGGTVAVAVVAEHNCKQEVLRMIAEGELEPEK